MFGYRVESDGASVTLHSTLAPSGFPGLVYRPSDGGVELVGGTADGRAQMQRLMDEWMLTGSLPCLVSGLTVGLWKAEASLKP